MIFDPFDPLKHKVDASSEVALLALKREIKEILGSYVGWYDPFCELIQNSLDSLELKRGSAVEPSYTPNIRIIIDLKDQIITVSDNGVGLTRQQFNQFLVPFFSFKTGKTRGHKGVGATYLAYGFNQMQIVTKNAEFEACGKMVNARIWLTDENPSGNPEVEHDKNGPIDSQFKNFDSGASISVKLDSTTHPKDLRWIGALSPSSWLKILQIKTGLGAIQKISDIKINLVVINPDGQEDSIEHTGAEYFYIEKFPVVRRSEKISILQSKLDDFYKKRGFSSSIPSGLQNFDCLFDTWNSKYINENIKIDEEEQVIINKYNPIIYFGFAYSSKLFKDFNESLNLRDRYSVISGGFQIASNNMPQGEIYQIPLQRYIGRQNQIHFTFHFDNYNADLGRKGYNKEITDFCKSISEKIVTQYLNKYKPYLRPTAGTSSDIIREKKVADWKNEMVSHENKNPLILINDKFFLPTRKISITSQPTREQDVISLFNQLIAGGVIRGIRIMSTNERFTYDGLYRVAIDGDFSHHIFNHDSNPLGILKDFIPDDLTFLSDPKVLEYKFSLDGLIEDISDETKNSNDIGLVVVWETGNQFLENYNIVSLLDEDNISMRQYHGVTHIIQNITTDQKEMDLIVLSELIEYLNDPINVSKKQKAKYDAY